MTKLSLNRIRIQVETGLEWERAMPCNKKQLAAAAICVAATFVNVSAAAVSTCDDVKLALASSKKFSEWKGKQIADNEWETTHTIFGFTKCVVVNRDFRCEQPSSSPDLAQRNYDAVRKLIEACLPRSEWMYNERADPLPSQGFVHPDGRNGAISLLKKQTLKPGTHTFEEIDTYWVQIIIFNHF